MNLRGKNIEQAAADNDGVAMVNDSSGEVAATVRQE